MSPWSHDVYRQALCFLRGRLTSSVKYEVPSSRLRERIWLHKQELDSVSSHLRDVRKWLSPPTPQFVYKTGIGTSLWPCAQESTCQCRGHGFDPWSGKIPHNAGQLSPWDPVTKSTYTTVHAPQQEKPLQWEACAPQLESGPQGAKETRHSRKERKKGHNPHILKDCSEDTIESLTCISKSPSEFVISGDTGSKN